MYLRLSLVIVLTLASKRIAQRFKWQNVGQQKVYTFLAAELHLKILNLVREIV